MNLLLDMLRWKRPGSGDIATEVFAETYLEPVFGEPDVHGNYILIIDKEDDTPPRVCFTAHYDTVHNEGGFQEVVVSDNNIASSVGDDCLGADCTTGIYLILEMIDAEIPGIYVVHADEESGCLGSEALVKDKPDWFEHTDAVISFDRRGMDSVVTHQMGKRTASNVFAKSLIGILGIDSLKSDEGGVYTDSNEYANDIPECTNISVGYYSQHTKSETQDLEFVEELRAALLAADWEKLEILRDPLDVDLLYPEYGYGWGRSCPEEPHSEWERQDLLELILAHPEDIADFFHTRNISASELAFEAGIDDSAFLNRFLEREVG